MQNGQGLPLCRRLATTILGRGSSTCSSLASKGSAERTAPCHDESSALSASLAISPPRRTVERQNERPRRGLIFSAAGSATASLGLFANTAAARYSTMTTSTIEKTSPLEGIKILDFTRIIAGPFATMLLSDLGAEVWKVERPKIGDESRSFKPPMINGESCYFISFNRNKKSIAVDIKSPQGKAIIEKLVKECDVLVENFLPDTMGRLGLGYEDLKKIAPQLIYCSISGYGPDGPYSNRGGFDVVAAALGGFLNITGPMMGEPVKAGIAATDLMTAQYAHGAILAALLQRGKTGVGQKIDCNLLSTQICSLTNIGSGYLNTGKEPQKWGTDHETVVPYCGFQAKDGKWLVIGAGNNKLWKQFCDIIGMPELVDKPEYKTNVERVQNRIVLTKILQDRFLEKTLNEWKDLFEPTSLPFGPVNNMEEAFNFPQVKHGNLVQEIEHPTAGTIKVTGPAVRYSASNNSVRSTPPVLGQHTIELLSSVLNMNKDELHTLKQSEVIDWPDAFGTAE